MQSFKLFMCIFLLGSSVLCLSISTANAALTNIDWKVADDELITGDDFGLEWLDLSETRDRSYNEVSMSLGAGQEFDGFRYATRSEVEGLWTSAGGDPNHYDGWSTQNNGIFDVLAPFWGDTYCLAMSCSAGEGYSWSVTAEVSGEASHHYRALALDLTARLESLLQDFFKSDRAEFGDGTTDTRVAHGLVRTSITPVPVPAAIWLFGTALIGMFGLNRRRKAA
jgi:hypothetical protein